MSSHALTPGMMVRKYCKCGFTGGVNKGTYVENIKDRADVVFVGSGDLFEALTWWKVEVHVEPWDLELTE